MFKYIFCFLLITLCFADSVNFVENEFKKHVEQENIIEKPLIEEIESTTIAVKPRTFFERLKNKMNDYYQTSKSKIKEYSSKISNFIKRKRDDLFNHPEFQVDYKDSHREIVFRIPMEGYSKKDILLSIKTIGTMDYIVIRGQTPISTENILSKAFEFRYPIPIKIIKEISSANFEDNTLIIQISKFIERDEVQIPIQ